MKLIHQWQGNIVDIVLKTNQQTPNVALMLGHVDIVLKTSQQTPNVALMLSHRLRRWANIKRSTGERRVFIVIIPVVL